MDGGRKSHHQLVRTLEGFSNSLLGNLERFIDVGDGSGVGTIWTCCVTCLGHLAALCHFVGQTEPTSRSSMDDLCDMTIEKLGNVSHEAHIEEYTHFDFLTGVGNLVDLFRGSMALTNNANRPLGRGLWTPSMSVLDYGPMVRADHCDIGEG